MTRAHTTVQTFSIHTFYIPTFCSHLPRFHSQPRPRVAALLPVLRGILPPTMRARISERLGIASFMSGFQQTRVPAARL